MTAAEGRALLEQVQASGEANAQRLYLLGEIARNENNENAVVQNLERIRQESPASPWFEQALLSAANMYLLEKNYDRAIDMFREIQQRFQTSPRASYANWKAAWLTYRQGRTEERQERFRKSGNVVSGSPRSSSRSVLAGAHRGRRARLRHGPGLVHEAGDRFHNYYYGYWDASGWQNCPPPPMNVALTEDATLAQIPELKMPGPEALELDAPPDQLRAEKSRLLLNAGLNEFAIRELQAEQGGQGARWATLQIARIYEDSGQNHRAIQFLKKALPGLLLGGSGSAAASLLGDIISASLLDGVAAAGDVKLAEPVSGGFAHSAGE